MIGREALNILTLVTFKMNMIVEMLIRVTGFVTDTITAESAVVRDFMNDPLIYE